MSWRWTKLGKFLVGVMQSGAVLGSEMVKNVANRSNYHFL